MLGEHTIEGDTQQGERSLMGEMGALHLLSGIGSPRWHGAGQQSSHIRQGHGVHLQVVLHLQEQWQQEGKKRFTCIHNITVMVQELENSGKGEGSAVKWVNLYLFIKDVTHLQLVPKNDTFSPLPVPLHVPVMPAHQTDRTHERSRTAARSRHNNQANTAS